MGWLRAETPLAAVLGSCTATVPEDLPTAITCGGALNAVEGLSAVTRGITATDPDDTIVEHRHHLGHARQCPDHPDAGVTAATADGGTASATLNVGTATAGTFVVGLIATNDDAPTPQTATCSINVSVLDVRNIGEIQGSVADDGQSRSTVARRSPRPPATAPGQTVATRGVVAQLTLAVTAAGVRNYGFFLQDPATATDGDATTSDGIFVFMGAFDTLIGGYEPDGRRRGRHHRSRRPSSSS